MYMEEHLPDWLVTNPVVLIRGTEPKEALKLLLNYIKGPIDFYTEEPEIKRLCEYLKLSITSETDSIWLKTGDTYELTEYVKASSQLWYFQVLNGKKANPRAILYFDMTIDIRNGAIHGIAHRA